MEESPKAMREGFYIFILHISCVLARRHTQTRHKSGNSTPGWAVTAILIEALGDKKNNVYMFHSLNQGNFQVLFPQNKIN